MRAELLSCGFIGLPRALGAGVVHVIDRHAGGGGFLKGFQPGNIDESVKYRGEPLSGTMRCATLRV
jgi:hypothetical protein